MLKGKTAIVTGAGNGIGKAVAVALAKAGASVAIADINLAAAQNTLREIEAAGGRGLAVYANVTVKDDILRLFSEVLSVHQRLDILVNNVGGTIRKPTIQFSEQEWDSLIDLNLKSVFLCSQQAGLQMLRQKSGVVINISSIHGLGGVPRRNPYAASKSAINSFTRTLACEWALDGVRVNAIAPGYILTEALGEAFREGSLNQGDMERRTPQGRLGTPDDISEAVLYLVSDKASFITGITLYVDGGYSAYYGPEAVPSFSHNLE